MAYEVGNKVEVDSEECKVIVVYGGGVGYMVKTPGGDVKKVMAQQVSEVPEKDEEEEENGENTGNGNGDNGNGDGDESEPESTEEKQT